MQERKKPREERLDRRNTSGYRDLTAYKAVAMIRHKAKLTGVKHNGATKA